MSNIEIYIRFADKKDIDDLYEWRNDPVTRKNSFNSDYMNKKEHRKWLYESLKNPQRQIFILVSSTNEKIGQVRFDNKEYTEAEIDIAISPNYRGRGYGTNAIKKASDIYLNNFKVDNIMAKIKNDNIASIIAFKRAGFKENKKLKDYIELLKHNEN